MSSHRILDCTFCAWALQHLIPKDSIDQSFAQLRRSWYQLSPFSYSRHSQPLLMLGCVHPSAHPNLAVNQSLYLEGMWFCAVVIALLSHNLRWFGYGSTTLYTRALAVSGNSRTFESSRSTVLMAMHLNSPHTLTQRRTAIIQTARWPATMAVGSQSMRRAASVQEKKQSLLSSARIRRMIVICESTWSSTAPSLRQSPKWSRALCRSSGKALCCRIYRFWAWFLRKFKWNTCKGIRLG